MTFSLNYTSSFINDSFVAKSGETATLVNPSTLEPICSVSYATKADFEYCLESAQRAQKEWFNLSSAVRRDMMLQLADKMCEIGEELAYLDCITNGKPIATARGDIQESINVVRYFAGFCDKISGSN